MAENTIFQAGLEIEPKFNRDKVASEIKKLKAQLDLEKRNLSKAVKIGVKIDISSFQKVTSQYAKAIEDISKALQKESEIEGFKGKNTLLFNVMKDAKKARVELGKTFDKYNKFQQKISSPIKSLETNKSNAIIEKSLSQNKGVLNLPQNNYDETKLKIEQLKNELINLNRIKTEIKLNDKQISKVDKAIMQTKKNLDSLSNSFKSLSNTKLINFKPKSINDINLAMNELKSRQQQLSLSTKSGANTYSKMENQLRALNVTKQEFIKKSKLETNTINQNTSAINKQSSAMNSLRNLASQYVGIYAARNVVRNIMSITAEFELQKVALGAIIQDQHKANQLFEQAKTQALESPFQVKDVVTFMKQLSAFQIDKNEIAETTSRLADISAGLGVDMGRIILAFGQVRAASVLRGQELRQFTEAGIPLVEKLAQKFTLLNGKLVTTSDVFELISERKVPFEMVRDVMWDMTDAGGAFFDMQKKQAKTLKGEISNLKDEIQVAYDRIGSSNSDFMKGFIRSFREGIKFGSENMDLISGLATAYLAARAGVLLYNKALSAQGIELIKNINLRRKMEIQEASLLRIFDKNVKVPTRRGSGGISKEDYRDAYLGDKLNKAETTRLFVYNKLSKEASDYALKVGMLNKATYDNITNLRMQTKSANIYTASIGRMKLGYIGLRVATINATTAMKAFASSMLLNPTTWIMVAATAIPALISKLREGKKAAKEFSKTLTADVEQNLFKLSENLGKINPNTKKDIQELNELIADTNNEENKKLLNSEKYQTQIRNINDTMIESIKENETLNRIVSERLSSVDNELDRYKKINEAVKEYQQIMGGIGANPDKLYNIIEDTNIDNITEDLYNSYKKVMKLIDKRKVDGVNVAGMLKAESDITKAYLENDWKEIKNVLKTTEGIKHSKEVQGFIANLNIQQTALNNFYAKTTAAFSLKTQKEKEQLKIYMDETYRLGDETVKKFIELTKHPIYIRYKMVEETTEPKKENRYIKELNQRLSKEGIFFEITNSPEREGWGFNEIAELLSKEIGKIETELDRANKAFKEGNIVKSLFGDKEEDEKYIKELQAMFDGASKTMDLMQLERKKRKERGDKGKTALELYVERVQSEVNKIKELKELQERYAKIKDKDIAGELASSLFTDENGKFTLPKQFINGYTDEIFNAFSKSQKDILTKMLSKTKSRQDKDKIASVLSLLDKEERNIVIKNNEKIISDILKEANDSINKVKEKVNLYEELFEATGDMDLANNIADVISGVDISKDSFSTLKNQLTKVLSAVYGDVSTEFKSAKLDIESANLFPDLEKAINLKDLPDDIKDNLQKIIKDAKDSTNKIILDAIKGLEKYKEIEQRKTDLVIRTSDKIDKIRKAGGDKELTERAIANLKLRKQAEEAKLTFEQFKDSFWYTEVFSNIDNMSVGTLKAMKAQLEKMRTLMKDALPSEIKTIIDKITEIDKKLVDEKIDWKAIFGNNTESITSARKEVEALQNDVDKLYKARTNQEAIINSPLPEIFKATARENLKNTTDKLIIANKNLEIAQQNEINQNNEQTKAIQNLNNLIDKQSGYMSELSSVIDDTQKVTNSLMKAFGRDESEDFAEIMGAMNETIAVAQSGLAILNSLTKLKAVFDVEAAEGQTLLNAAMAANPAFFVVAGITALIGALKLYQYFANKAANDEISDMNDEIEKTDELIKQMENSLSDLAGSDYYRQISSQIAITSNKVIAAQRQLAAEQSKTKPDEDKVKEYTNTINDYQQDIIDKQKELVESLAGGDLKAITDNIVNVFFEAYKSGTNTFAAIKSSFSEMINNMIKQTIAAKVISKYLQDVFDYIGTMVEDGSYGTGSFNTLSQMLLQASQSANHALSSLAPYISNMDNLFGTSTSSFNNLASGISNASEESISTLAGYWLSHLNITQVMAQNVANIELMLRERYYNVANPNNTSLATTDAATQQYLQTLLSIDANTRLSAEKVTQFYDKFNQVVVVNPNGDSAFGLRTINQ